MKLVYLYIKINRNPKDSEINLDSNVRFSFDGVHLEVVEKKILPDGFFSVSGGSSEVVESVSAIVGENGAGKTSIARHIAEIVSGKNTNRKFIAVFLIEGKYVAVYNKKYVDYAAFEKIAHLIPENQRYTHIEFRSSFLYVSPHFTLEPVLKSDGVNVFDYSTAGLMSDKRLRTRNLWGLYNYAAGEYLRALTVISAYKQAEGAPSEPGDILSRSGVEIKIRRSARMLQQSFSMSSAHRPEQAHPVLERFLTVYNRMQRIERERNRPESFLMGVLQAFLISRVKEHARISSNEDVYVVECVTEIYEWLYGDYADHDYWRIEDQIMCKLRDVFARRDHSRVIDGLQRLLEGARELTFKFDREIKRDSIVVQAEWSPVVGDLLVKLVEGYSDCVGEEDFLQFKFSPALSSGEMSFLGMWGRLFQFFKDRERTCDGVYHAIVYLDESETALHPEWQRKLVWYTIWFMEHFARHAQVHIIYATHSPILLSDIPMGNVHFLRGSHDHGFRQRIALQRLPNTFAANIYDLYRLPFFMQKGTIGEFALGKVNGLIKPQSILDKEALEQLVDLVGDKMIRCYLQNKYALEER